MSALTRVRRATVEVRASAEESGMAGADLITGLLLAGDLHTLGVATGSSPSPLYEELARRGVVLSGVTLFALDEYIGLPDGDPESYRAVVQREVADPLHVPADMVHVPDSGDPTAYERLIADHGGIDLQLLGIGRNGHIGFNEPGSSFESRTRIVDLDETTRQANARFFHTLDDVPRRSVTQGISTILAARRLMILASGLEKAPAVAAALSGPRTEQVPASVLRDHSEVTWLIDQAAASLLPGA